nr:hypothetical protein Iba_chr01dCG9150 [Ipomoea batatas]
MHSLHLSRLSSSPRCTLSKEKCTPRELSLKPRAPQKTGSLQDVQDDTKLSELWDSKVEPWIPKYSDTITSFSFIILGSGNSIFSNSLARDSSTSAFCTVLSAETEMSSGGLQKEGLKQSQAVDLPCNSSPCSSSISRISQNTRWPMKSSLLADKPPEFFKKSSVFCFSGSVKMAELLKGDMTD